MTASVGTISYGVSALAYLFLSLLLLTSWRGRVSGAMLVGACLLSALWAAAVAFPAGAMGALAGEILEVLRNGAWLAFLVVLLGLSVRGSDGARFVRPLAGGVAALCALMLVLTAYFHLRAGRAGGFPDPLLAIVGQLMFAVMGMALVEQLYRNAHPEQRWGIKFLCFGLGGMFAYDFYLYADALLFQRVDRNIWDARGIVNALIVPLIAVSAARNPKWSLAVSVSRRILFHSAALFGAGVYLMVMAAAGYYIRYFGGTWGAVLQATFLFGAVVVLFAMLFSGTLRARLKVFVSKHFFSYRYDYREEWLRFTRTLSEGDPGGWLPERAIKAIAELVESPAGALWLARDGGAFEPAGHWNMPSAAGIEPADGALARFLEARQWVVSLEEHRVSPESYGGLELPGWLQAVPRAWLVVPLLFQERLLGFAVLARSRVQVRVNWEVRDLLKTAARQAASFLAQHEAANALVVARQFESFNRMSAFIVHDLKNVVAQLSLMLANAERHGHNPVFQRDMIGTVEHAVGKMKRLLTQLRGESTSVAPAPVRLDEVARQAVAERAGLKPAPVLEAAEEGLCVNADRERLGRVVGHLVQNAIEATPPGGRVAVRLCRQDGQAVLEVSDSGCGMSEQFIRDGLFRPFHSTKKAGMGIGAYESRHYVSELGGRIEVRSREAEGTTFRVILPLCGAAGAVEETVLQRGTG
jgi:putative PEP-CTERM system histidine kinase